MSLALEGTLEDIRLCDLLRLVARESRTGSLRVTIDGVSFELRLHAGSVTHVRAGDEAEILDLEPTVMALVRHRRGTFQLLPAEDADAEASAEGLHAEALAGKGDMALMALEERLDGFGGERSVPERDAFPTPRQMDEMSPALRTVYGLVDGARNLGELVVRSRLDPARVLDGLEALAEDSLITLTGPAPAPGAAPAPAAARGAQAAVRRGLADAVAAVVPLVIAVAGLGLVAAFQKPAAAPEPFEIRDDPLAAARAAHGAARLRAAVEAHRFVEGRWPDRLGALVERGYVPEAALADARGRSYYYAVRDDGFILLAPER